MFIDWIDAYQDFSFPLPLLGDKGFIVLDTVTGHLSDVVRCPRYSHEGSFSTVLTFKVSGNRLSVSGNPSRFNRLDNLVGFTSLDDCFSVINFELLKLGLPPFSKCTISWFLQAQETSKHTLVSDGATITRLDITSNKIIGQGVELDFLKGFSTLSYRNSIPKYHTDGRSVEFLSKMGKANLIRAICYDKAYEMRLHLLKKVKKQFGSNSYEYNYVLSLIKYCESVGVLRFEQKLKSEFLRRNHFRFWGLFDFNDLKNVHNQFLSIHDKLQVTAMTFETIGDKLLELGIVKSRQSANATERIADKWAHGHNINMSERQLETYRARLRKIGIDISRPCDLSKFSPIIVKKVREVVVQDFVLPDFYQKPLVPTFLKRVA